MGPREPGFVINDDDFPQPGRNRMVVPQPITRFEHAEWDGPEPLVIRALERGDVLMMGDNPTLSRLPEKPALTDFFKLRFSDMAVRHLLQSAKLALDDGQDEKVVLACLLHDISNGALLRSDHGYWGAQLIAPYVSEEIAWAVRFHQPLRYFEDHSVGYSYPEAYTRYFGTDYNPPEYIRQAHDEARKHRWYMSSRLITLYDIYSFEDGWDVDIEEFNDIIGRNFRQPAEGLGFDNSPTAHMWRTMIWPNNFL